MVVLGWRIIPILVTVSRLEEKVQGLPYLPIDLGLHTHHLTQSLGNRLVSHTEL